MNRLLSSIVWTAAVFCGLSTGGFTFHPIGNYPNSFETFPRGLNLSRTVVGLYIPMGAFQQGYLQVGKNYKTIAPPGALNSFLQGINDKGTAVGGFCTVSCNAGSSQHGYLYSHGKYTKFDYPAAGVSTAPQGINNLGEIVGGYCPAQASSCPGGFLPSAHAFLLKNGSFSTLDFPSALATQAQAINDSGSIVGFYMDSATRLHAYLYQGGVFTALNFPTTHQWTLAEGINNAGTISGIFQDNNFITHGFTYSNGVFTQSDPPNSTASGLGGINNKGEVTASANINNIAQYNFIGVPTASDSDFTPEP